MAGKLDGLKVAILATDGVEQVELVEPRRALEQAGATVELVAPKADRIQAFNHLDRGETFKVDRTLGEVKADDYDALFLPGGVANPDALRLEPQAVDLVRGFFAARKPVGAICHGPWLLVEADTVRHRSLTSWPSLRTDIENAGGIWVDERVHVDDGLVTSRKPDDLPAFCEKLIEEVAEGPHLQPQSMAAGGQGGDARAVVRYAPVHARHDVPPGDEDAVVDVASADSYPASDAPSSLKTT